MRRVRLAVTMTALCAAILHSGGLYARPFCPPGSTAPICSSAAAKRAAATLKDPDAILAGGASECQWQCLTAFRECLRTCHKTNSCQQCTVQFSQCKKACPPPELGQE